MYPNYLSLSGKTGELPSLFSWFQNDVNLHREIKTLFPNRLFRPNKLASSYIYCGQVGNFVHIACWSQVCKVVATHHNVSVLVKFWNKIWECNSLRMNLGLGESELVVKLIVSHIQVLSPVLLQFGGQDGISYLCLFFP